LVALEEEDLEDLGNSNNRAVEELAIWLVECYVEEIAAEIIKIQVSSNNKRKRVAA
jgi:predicted HAD superfamily phosphohydrolase YqeG